MENSGEGRTRRQEILMRLNANEELLGMSKAKPDPNEEERQRNLEDGIAQSEEWAMRSSALAGGCGAV